MSEAMNSTDVSPKLQRIATIAKQHPDQPLNPLAHYIDEAWLFEAYRRTRKHGAVGVDGQTAGAYAQELSSNLRSLRDRARSGRYRAPPVRRSYIPKGDGAESRPLGIPTFEDKVLQRAVAMVLEAVYEPFFHEGSYGFRPGRSAHQALEATWHGLMGMGGGWVLEIDIRKFFETVDHDQLRSVLRQRVRDGDILRLINKWLKAGVMEAGEWHASRQGTPQGGVISPILANIFLHEVLDQWFEHTVKPRLCGQARLVRFADDAVLLFEHRGDAHRVMNVLPKRFARYGLSLHPEKTRLVPFRRPPKSVRRLRCKPGTFDLLGFTHYWARSRRGSWVIKRKTAKDRFSRALKAINQWCRQHRHWPIPAQWAALWRKLKGLYAYYGIIGNVASLACLRYRVRRIWRFWLGRRSQRGRMPWARYVRLLETFPLPEPRRVAGV